MAVEVLSASSPEDREDLLAKLYSTLAGDIPDVFGDALAVHFLLLGQLFWSTHFLISFFFAITRTIYLGNTSVKRKEEGKKKH